MFHGIKYLIVSLVFSHLGFWGGNLFLIAPFPDLCLLVLFFSQMLIKIHLKHHGGGGKVVLGFGPGRIRTLVSMATDSSHRRTMGKT